jgi:hypothetical protein
MDHADLQRLWRLADETPRAKGTPRDGVFEPIGLILSRPLQRATYRSTPANTLAFAWTGGDGVHFNFVLRDGRVAEDSPILMSVPASFDAPNVIVGRDLRDFLALGVGRGFFSLERLVYDPKSFLDDYPASEEELDELQRDQLRLLRAAFAVEPWSDAKGRLEELEPLVRLLEPPAAQPPPAPMPSPDAFWQAQLDRERARPADERDPVREAHMEARLAEVRKGG